MFCVTSGDSSESDTDHHYEMLYEVAAPANQDVPFDDFDSDNSDDLRPSQPPSMVSSRQISVKSVSNCHFSISLIIYLIVVVFRTLSTNSSPFTLIGLSRSKLLLDHPSRVSVV